MTQTVQAPLASLPSFPLDQWYVAGFSWELKDAPLARTLLGQPLVLFRTADGQVAALEDRCCHRELPLSCGTVEDRGLRCGYHGMLYDHGGRCLEIPGQERIPAKACVKSFELRERDQILWIWMGTTPDSRPAAEPPAYAVHSDPDYRFGGGVYHYDAPYQLIHDNLLDLSHLGYVHLKTIGGNASIHMNAELKVSQEGDSVKVVRWMPDSEPPPTYAAAWPFKGRIDRWQEVEFHPSHVRIWTGAMDKDADRLDNPQRQGFHMRGFHGVTPETETSAHYFWTIATNPHPGMQDPTQLVIDQTAATFEEDKVVIEAQFRNQQRFGSRPVVDIHVDVGPNRARRVIERLRAASARAREGVAPA
ncbi:Rieske 2Fe-2S domain-containing protein [Comamonas guangdongensis]|uniref:Rieske 2Fe-2S domain-containing protein n=1 Tax=Comamonas guangdongensis TaxID=510515 RepID=A0ABV3ZUQ0_9BURK